MKPEPFGPIPLAISSLVQVSLKQPVQTSLGYTPKQQQALWTTASIRVLLCMHGQGDACHMGTYLQSTHAHLDQRFWSQCTSLCSRYSRGTAHSFRVVCQQVREEPGKRGVSGRLSSRQCPQYLSLHIMVICNPSQGAFFSLVPRLAVDNACTF